MPDARGVYAGFAVFGGLWGAWGASIPAIRDQAGLSDGELGTALLFVGAGALPAMLMSGRAVDRWGHRVTAGLLILLAGAGVAVALTTHGFISLAAGLTALGAASGAADVAINAAAGSAERATGRPVIGRAHGAFSAAVVLASLTTGRLAAAGAPIVTPFLLVAVAAVVAAAIVGRESAGRRELVAGGDAGAVAGRRGVVAPRRRAAVPQLALLLVAGGLAALAFAVENAHQSWSAVYLRDALSAGAGGAAAGPAVFAGIVAATRFSAAPLGRSHPVAVVVGGAATAAAGTALVAAAATLPVGLAGVGIAAAGTAVLFPTLLGVVAARVPDAARGTATSVVTAVAYLGFLAGPVYVGAWAAAADLPSAMLAVAGLAAALALLTWPALRAVRSG